LYALFDGQQRADNTSIFWWDNTGRGMQGVIAAIAFIVVYLIPIAGVVTGCILLKKKPEKKLLGLTVLLISIAVCLAVAVWKINDIINFQ